MKKGLVVVGISILVVIMVVVGGFGQESQTSSDGNLKLFWNPDKKTPISEIWIGSRGEQGEVELLESWIDSNLELLSNQNKDVWNDPRWKKQQIQRLNKKFNVEFNENSNFDGSKIDGNKFVDANGKKHEFPEGSKVMITPKEITLETSTDIIKIETGTGEYIAKIPKSVIDGYNDIIGQLDEQIRQLIGESRLAGGERGLTGGGQSGGGQSGGSGGGGGQEIMSAVQGAVQFAQSLIGGLADSWKSSGGRSSIASNNRGGITSTFDDGAVGLFGTDDKLALGVEQNNPEDPTEADLDKEKKGDFTNANVLIPDEMFAQTTEKTTVEFNGIPGDDPNNPPITDSEELLTSPQLSPITAQVVAQGEIFDYGQYIKLKNHDLDISGEDITVYALKTFNEVIVGGQNLKVFDGEIEMKFEGQRIYYPRLVKNAPYGVKQISNKLDQNNKFRLQHYTNKKGSLIDNREIISVSDITTNHPRNDLIISKIRLPMWETS